MHLSSYQINRYRHAGLAALELLAMDDHLLACEFCRQQLRSDLHWQAALPQLRTNLLRLPTEEHVAPERRAAFVHNRLDAIERELVTSHLQGCPTCAAQTQFLRDEAVEAIPTVGALWAGGLAFLHERAVLIWPMPVAAILVMVTVTIADYFYLRHHRNTAVPAVISPNPVPVSPRPPASPSPLNPRLDHRSR